MNSKKIWRFIYKGKNMRLDACCVQHLKEFAEDNPTRCQEDSHLGRDDCVMLKSLTRGQWVKLIKAGVIRLNGTVTTKASQKVNAEAYIQIDLEGLNSFKEEEAARQPKLETHDDQVFEYELPLLYEDEWVWAFNKPAGLVVHPGSGTPLETMMGHLARHLEHSNLASEWALEDQRWPGLIHRLDRDTSGIVLCAKTPDAQRAFTQLFLERSIRKVYWAWCLGRLKDDEIELKTGHRRHPKNRLRFTTDLAPPEPSEDGEVDRRNRLAWSIVRTRQTILGISWVEVEIKTGRTHQIRAHLSDLGHPILNDELYNGGKLEKRLQPSPQRDALMRVKRQALHARELFFTHPMTGEEHHWVAPLNDGLKEAEEAFSTLPIDDSKP